MTWQKVDRLTRTESDLTDCFSWGWFAETGCGVKYVYLYRNDDGTYRISVGVDEAYAVQEAKRAYICRLEKIMPPMPGGCNSKIIFTDEEPKEGGVVELRFSIHEDPAVTAIRRSFSYSANARLN